MSDRSAAQARDAPIGGQAVLEGVMMRGVSTWAVAVRKPSPEQLEREGGQLEPTEAALGEIEIVSEPLVSITKRHRLLRLPLIRGVAALGRVARHRLQGARHLRQRPARGRRGRRAGDRRRHLGRHRHLRRPARHRPLLPAAGRAHLAARRRAPELVVFVVVEKLIRISDLPRLPLADLAHARPPAGVRVPRRRAQDDLLLRGGSRRSRPRTRSASPASTRAAARASC